MSIIHKCNKCGESKELNILNYKTNKVNGKIYFEKTCKICRQKKATSQAKKRYHSDLSFKLKKLNSTEKSRKKNQELKNESWRKRIELTKKWKQENKAWIKEVNKDRHKRRWLNPTYRISKNMSNYVNKHIKDKNLSHVFDILGYSIKDLMSHLEAQFKEGMSWTNYGQWHIDHIIPICSFNIQSKNDQQFKECWSLKNLRPLWKEENLIKSSQDKLKALQRI